jgi:hypothetical protein
MNLLAHPYMELEEFLAKEKMQERLWVDKLNCN